MEAILFATKNAKINVFKKSKKKIWHCNIFLQFQITVMQLCDIICYQNGFGLQFWQNAIHETFKRGERDTTNLVRKKQKGQSTIIQFPIKNIPIKLNFRRLIQKKTTRQYYVVLSVCFFFQLYFHHDLFLTWPTFYSNDKLENVYTKNILFLPFQN